MEAGEWPIAIIATQDVSCGARLWSAAGKRRATVIVKVTMAFVRCGPMRLASPAPILLGDQHHDSSLQRSVAAAADMAPYLPRAEVLLTGHAYAPSPAPFMPVRLALVGSRPLVDKTLHVFGERMWLEGDQTTAPVPFTRIPLRYERASTGPVGYEENPVGMPQGVGLPVFNVVDPDDPSSPAGFGPIAPFWPARRRLLRNLDPAAVEVAEPALPDTFAWSFFHAAPPDQRCTFFEGNEWVVLEGLHPELPRLETQLPSARAQARVYGIESTGHREVGLVADTLWIDPDRSIACLIWRGNFEVESDAALQNAQVFAGVELPGRPIPWPGSASRSGIDRSSDVPTAAPTRSPVAADTEDEPPTGARGLAPPVTSRDGSPWMPGATLASPGVIAADLGIRTVVSSSPVTPRPPESITNVHLDAKLAEQRPAQPVVTEQGASSTDPPTVVPVVSAASPSLALTMSSTVPQPPSDLRALIAKAAEPSTASPSFEDVPTYAPDQSDVARIVEEAERLADAERTEQPLPAGVRPSPQALRSAKTTIRGLGDQMDEDGKRDAPPTARAAPAQLKSLMQSEEQPTAQLKVPDALLQMSVESARSPQGAPGPTTVDEEDDAGRPTFHSREQPAFSAVAAKPPPVHYGEMRLEVERRIREGESLQGLDLSDVDLSGFDLSGQNLDGSRLDRASFKGSRLRGTNLSGASLEGADLSGADLDDAILERTNLVSAKLVGASLRRAFLTDANLTTANARGAQLDQASGLRTIFCRAKLEASSFAGVTLDGADFTEAQIDGANLEGALLPELRAYEVSAESAVFSRCSLRGARFDGAVLGRARFDGAHADDSIWDRCVLDGASLDGARLVGASFTKASLREASFRGADLAEARFNRAILQGAKMVGIDLGSVTLDGADLTNLVTGEGDV